MNSLRVERPTKTLKELALEKMREAILKSHFAPGERLVERRLCDSLGISRTVVREVLRHLETEGLVETRPNQGPIVAQLDPASAEEIYEIRMVLEARVARSCAEIIKDEEIDKLRSFLLDIRADFENKDSYSLMQNTTKFYEVMFKIAGKNIAWEIICNLNARINQLRALTLASDQRSVTGPLEMEKIIEALQAHDADAAEKACQEHVQNAFNIAKKRLEDYMPKSI